MTVRVWVRHGWTTAVFALVLIHVCLGQRDCTGVDCPHLDSCIEEVLEDGGCCATCLQRGCVCKGYQFYDCISTGFKNGKVPEGASYLVDSGSTECRCPAGGGDIKCRFIPCPDVPSHCIELSDPTEGCPHCLRLGCVHQHHKYEAGHSFHMDPCQVCHCPNDGGDLMCSVIPDCSSETKKNSEKKQKELPISKRPEDQKLSRNSVLIYTEDLSEVEESEDYDYFPEATTSPENETKDLLSFPTSQTDLTSTEFSSPRETVGRHTKFPPAVITPSATEDIGSDHRNLQHTIPEPNPLPKLQFVSTTTPPVKIREREAHRQPQTLGRYHQDGNDLHPTSHKQRGLEQQAFSLEEREDRENMVEQVKRLEDVDECRVYAGQLCHHQCVNTQGSYVCVCFPGFVLQPDGIQCLQEVSDDEDVTLTTTSLRPAETSNLTPSKHSDPCEGNGHCTQHCHLVKGEAHCFCDPGFTLMPDGRSCEDINECRVGAHSCGPGSDCINTDGSFSCKATPRCPGGFTLDSQGQCTDVDECRTVTQPCSPGFNCVNTAGSYTCQRKIILCGRGYHSSPDGTRCIDSDECESGVHHCGEEQICQNLPGTYRCDCLPGYQFDMYRRTCVDVNECWLYSARLCTQVCVNTAGSYHCSCNSGFTLSTDAKSCEDVNECLSSPCSHKCVNVYGSYQCYCRQGYYLQEDKHTCEDVDECSQSVGHLCSYKCVNVPGSYNCVCPEPGYRMAPNHRSCQDIDECTGGAHNCTADETCYNIHGGFRCLSFNCPTNYRQASDSRCERISCSNFLECQNSPVRITYYQLSFQMNIMVPALVFRMGPSPAYSGDNVIISIANGNEGGYFSPRKLNAYTGAVYLQQQLQQPRDFLLDVEMKLWRQGTFTTFLARIYIFITQNVV